MNCRCRQNVAAEQSCSAGRQGFNRSRCKSGGRQGFRRCQSEGNGNSLGVGLDVGFSKSVDCRLSMGKDRPWKLREVPEGPTIFYEQLTRLNLRLHNGLGW